MTGQSGGGGVPSGVAGGALTGTYPSPTLAAGQVPGELGYVQTTAAQTGIGTSFTDLTSLALTVTVGTRAIVLEACLSLPNTSSSANRILLQLVDTTSGTTALVATAIAAPSASVGYTASIKLRLTPAAGSHSYKVQAAVDGGTMTTGASVTEPAWFQVREL